MVSVTEEIDIRPKAYRRRKKFSTEEFVAQFNHEEAGKRADIGLYCKDCRKRRRWTQLAIVWDWFRAADDQLCILRNWVCKDCGGFLQEDEMDLVP